MCFSTKTSKGYALVASVMGAGACGGFVLLFIIRKLRSTPDEELEKCAAPFPPTTADSDRFRILLFYCILLVLDVITGAQGCGPEASQRVNQSSAAAANNNKVKPLYIERHRQGFVPALQSIRGVFERRTTRSMQHSPQRQQQWQ